MPAFAVEHVVALAIFTSYFLLIFGLFLLITSSIWKHSITPKHPGPVWLFGTLTVASLGHTWFWMFKYMLWSFHKFESMQAPQITQRGILMRMANWLTRTALFEEAWSAVCRTPLNWWWSEQLCLFTAGAFTVFLFRQRERVPHVWAYMLLGHVVAISVAWSLLNVALITLPSSPYASKRPKSHLPLLVTAPVVLSLLTISVSPSTSTSTFLPNLLAMHALLIVPLLPLPQFAVASLSPRASSFYTLIALLSLTLRIRTTVKLLSFLGITSSPFFSLSYPGDLAVILWNAPAAVYGAAWDTLHAHPAQASLGWDVVWTCIVWFGWGWFGNRELEEGRWKIADGLMSRCVLPAMVVSVGVVAPMEFGRDVREDESKME